MLSEESNINLAKFYYVNIRGVIRSLHQMWGESIRSLKKIKPDDQMRLFGILLGDENTRDYCADLIGDATPGCRPGTGTIRGRIVFCYLTNSCSIMS